MLRIFHWDSLEMNTNYIFYIYGSYLPADSASPSLSLSLSEIEVDNIFFQHKGRNPQEQYFLSMKFCMDWTFFCKSKYPNISYSWFIRILSFLSLIYLSFFSLIGSELETDFQNLGSMDRLLRFHIFNYLPPLHPYRFYFCTSKQRHNQLHYYWLWQGSRVDKDT